MNKTDLLAAADRIGFQLCREAVWDAGICNWLGWSSEFPDGRVTYAWRALGPSIYDGTAGIAWFLSHLGLASGEALHRRAALGAIAHAMLHHDNPGPRNTSGFFSGSLGIAVAAIEIGSKLQTGHLVETGLALLQASARLGDEEREIDLIGGSAGAIPILIGVGHSFRDQSFLDLAVMHADELLRRSTRQRQSFPAHPAVEDGWERCWKNPAFGPEGLTGYSHGAAGILNALLEVFRLTGQSQYRSAAREALAFERRWFDQTSENWLDLRDGANGPEAARPAGCSWCHGAPGIGLARLRTLELLPDDTIVSTEISSAVATTLRSLENRQAAMSNFSLCHGLLGNAELPLAAKEKGLDVDDARPAVEEVVSVAMDRHARTDTPWRCGTQDGRSVPGLMLGMAGIAAALLRAYDPAAIRLPILLTPNLFSPVSKQLG